MESIPAEVGKTCLDIWINKAIKESSYMCCFTCIAEDFKKEIETLTAKRLTVSNEVEAAKGRAEDIRSDVRHWEGEADKLIQEDTTSKTNKSSCFFGLCPNLKWRYSRGKELANKIVGIKKLIDEKIEQLENFGIPARPPDVERRTSHDYIPFESRRSKYKELLDALKDESNYITGLQGMGGTGKSKLAEEVGKQLKQSNQFCHVISVLVSSLPDVKKIQDAIAGPLGFSFESQGYTTESSRQGGLWKRLTNGEKILLILNDVWDPHVSLDAIGIPRKGDHKGCRVLVTTRNLRVCRSMECEKKIQLKVLSDDDAFLMLKSRTHMPDNSSQGLLLTARNIAIECKGLPIAIEIIAGRLKSEQRQEEWDAALNSLQKPASKRIVDENLIEIYKCLKYSYDNMKDEKDRGLFLLCSVFQQAEKIPTDTLIRIGIGAGVCGEDYGCYKDARSDLVAKKNKLVESCLLMETDEGCVEMHDMVREVAQLIANKEILAVNLSNKNNQKSLLEREKNIKYLLCEGKNMDVFSSHFDGSKLETLIVFFDKMDDGHHHVEVPNSFFENVAGLRVLSLSYQDQPTLSLPLSVHSLKNIRSLVVSRVHLVDISALGKLQTLETLDFVWCIIDELPHQISKLEKLKLLNFVYCKFQKSNPFEVIKNCSSLEELYFRHSFNGFSGVITLPALQRYHVYRELPIMKDSLLKCVAFEMDGKEDLQFFSEATLKYLMQTAEALQLKGILTRGQQHRNLMPDIVPIDQGMNDLVELRLQKLQIECLIDTKHINPQVPNAFSKLVVLNLYRMKKLKELCNGPLSFDSLKSLEELSIDCCQHLESLFKCKLNLCNLKTIILETCPVLVSVFQLSTARSLDLLEELKIIDCEILENIIVDGANDNDNQSLGPMFPNLKVLDIQSCPQLEFILPFHSAQDLSVLETINISFCDNLKYIFGQHQAVKLGSLKEPILHEVPNFISIFPDIKASSPPSDGSKAQIQLDPVKCSFFSWTDIWFSRLKLRSTTSTKIPLVSEDQQQDFPILSGVKEPEDHCIPEGSTSGKTATAILSDKSKARIQPPTPLVTPIQKDIKISVGEGTSSAKAKTIASSSHMEGAVSSSLGLSVTSESECKTYSLEDGDSQITVPSFSIVNIKPPATKDVEIGDSQGTTESNADSAIDEINELIKEDPVLELEKLLTGKVSVSSNPQKTVAESETEMQNCSVEILLQELKTLMDSSDLDHLVSNQESKSKLITLFQQLNQQDQRLLSSDIRDFIKKVQNFFSDHFVKHANSQLVLKKHNQILDSKMDLTNKLWSAKFTQNYIENATSTAKTEMNELSSQIVDLRKKLEDLENQRDDLESVVNKCNVQKNELMAECTQWVQQGKELLSALDSSEISVQEAEHVRNLAKESFANLKSSFPTF